MANDEADGANQLPCGERPQAPRATGIPVHPARAPTATATRRQPAPVRRTAAVATLNRNTVPPRTLHHGHANSRSTAGGPQRALARPPPQVEIGGLHSVWTAAAHACHSRSPVRSVLCAWSNF